MAVSTWFLWINVCINIHGLSWAHIVTRNLTVSPLLWKDIMAFKSGHQFRWQNIVDIAVTSYIFVLKVNAVKLNKAELINFSAWLDYQVSLLWVWIPYKLNRTLGVASHPMQVLSGSRETQSQNAWVKSFLISQMWKYLNTFWFFLQYLCHAFQEIKNCHNV